MITCWDDCKYFELCKFYKKSDTRVEAEAWCDFLCQGNMDKEYWCEHPDVDKIWEEEDLVLHDCDLKLIKKIIKPKTDKVKRMLTGQDYYQKVQLIYWDGKRLDRVEFNTSKEARKWIIDKDIISIMLVGKFENIVGI